MTTQNGLDSGEAAPSESTYPVGYRKPPTQNRFRPGQSGNPKGRPKGALGVRSLVNSALDETVRVAENGKARSIRKRQAILLAMIAKAIKGDVRAAVLIMRLMESHDPAPRLPDGHLSHEDWLELLADDKFDDKVALLSQAVPGDGTKANQGSSSAAGGR
jgi:hypothetical protein